MDTHRYTLQQLLVQPQRLVVPLFQRGYAWSEDVQWRPLWDDVLALAEASLRHQRQTHFIGAIVLQASPPQPGGLTTWEVIDGQQRLTTMQILADAVAGTIKHEANSSNGEARLLMLTENPEAFRSSADDRFKLLPTNRDRDAYLEVLAARAPVDYGSLQNRGHRIISAHAFFTRSASLYLQAGSEFSLGQRAEALVEAISDGLELVGITLTAQENSQAIFETMNARMTPLQPTDLIKNFLFQRIAAEGGDVQSSYDRLWREFEAPFWEAEVSQGRYVRPRFTAFINHWLVSRLAEEVPPGEVFRVFKRFADAEPDASALLAEIRAAADSYRALLEKVGAAGELNGLELTAYRLTASDISVFWPVALWLLDADRLAGSPGKAAEALSMVESWIMRRVLAGATASAYNRLVIELLRQLRAADSEEVVEVVRRFLTSQTAPTAFWPGDEFLRTELRDAPVYRKLVRARLRVVLEALEDEARGFVTRHARTAHARMTRAASEVEHIMPVNWVKNWPISDYDPEARDRLVHSLGNLALLPKRFNASVSDAPWGNKETGKRHAFHKHSADLLLRDVLEADVWDEAQIEARTNRLIEAILRIWPVPEGHVGNVGWVDPSTSVSMAELIDDGLLQVGQSLYARGKANESYARVLANGNLEVAGVEYSSPSAAARAARGLSSGVNGMWFWLVDRKSLTSLSDLRQAYVLRREALQAESDAANV